MKKFLLALAAAAVLWGQVPTAQPQPATSPYSTVLLNLLPTYDRTSYQATFHTPAPAFDITKPAKNWVDTTKKCDNGSSTYQSLTPDMQPKFVPFVLSNCDAAVVNLAGLPTFAAYVPNQISNVNVACSLPSCTPVPIGPALQATMLQAQSLLADIGDPTLTVTDAGQGPIGPGSPFGYSKANPASDVSIYMVGQMNVGTYWAMRNAKGVGYPGTWTKVSAGVYNWTPGVVNDGSTSTLPAVPLPVRLLLPNEKFSQTTGTLIPVPIIVRTDVAQTPGAGLSSDISFGSADRDTLNQILTLLKKISGQ